MRLTLPIPDLNEFGVLPPGQHICSLDEVRPIYATNDHREALWEQFLEFVDWMAGRPKPPAVLIDGGFTSDKPNPKDIDVVLDCFEADEDTQNYWVGAFLRHRKQIMENFNVDLWVRAEYFQNDLSEFFTYVRIEEALQRGMGPNDRKGLLRFVP